MSKKEMTIEEMIQKLRKSNATRPKREPTEKEKAFEKKFRAQFKDYRKKKQ